MLLARVLSKIYKEDGIILQDKNVKYVIGKPNSERPVTVKLLNKKLKYLLLVEPEYYFPEAYMNEELIIKKGTIEELINLVTNCYDDFISNNKFS